MFSRHIAKKIQGLYNILKKKKLCSYAEPSPISPQSPDFEKQANIALRDIKKGEELSISDNTIEIFREIGDLAMDEQLFFIVQSDLTLLLEVQILPF